MNQPSLDKTNPRLFYGSILVAILMVVAALFIAQHFKAVRPDASSMQQATTRSQDDRLAHPDKTFAITVKAGALISGPSTMTVKAGDSVRVNLTAQGEEAQLKLEGYDITTEADPSDNTPGGFAFIADKTGSFNFYSLGERDPSGVTPPAQTQLGTITVQ